MKMLVRRTTLFVTLAVAAACGGDASPAAPTTPPPPPPSVAGSWSGTASGVTLSLTITEASGSVSGTGQINGPSGALALTVSGTFVNPNLSINMNAQGFQPINYSAVLSGTTTLTGTLNGSGFNNVGITLKK